MAFGGGIFTSQNKKLPGAYINFVSASAVAQEAFARGVAAMGLSLDWGPEGAVFSVTRDEFYKNARAIFGYGADAPQLRGLRDLFINAHTLRAYRLNGGGAKASNSLAETLYGGKRGNDISISVAANQAAFLSMPWWSMSGSDS